MTTLPKDRAGIERLTGKKHYDLIGDAFVLNSLSFVVEIDHDVVKLKDLQEVNEFWSNDKARENSYGVLGAVLRLLALQITRLVLDDNNVHGVIRAFAWGKDDSGGLEGWPEMDGSKGWKILGVDSFDYDADDFEVEMRDRLLGEESSPT